MLGQELLHEIRSMDSTSAVTSAHSRLLKCLRDVSAHRIPSTHGLCQCSMLCGAFCRRLAVLDVSVVHDSAEYLAPLRAALDSVASPTQEATLFAYAVGEIETLRTTRRATFRQRIDDLTKSVPPTRWDVERIAALVRELSAAERRSTQPSASRALGKRQRDGSDAGTESGGPVAVRWRLPLRDPITLGAVVIPVRGAACQHQEVFDLESFVRATQQALARREESVEEVASHKWGGCGSSTSSSSEIAPCTACPVCGRATTLHSLRVDEDIIEAMRQHTEKGGRLGPNDCVVWDATTRAYCVEEHPTADREVEDVPEAEPSRPPRVVLIEGHVLYAED
ncbi:hypothetical protein DQ04_00641050 [Trypanosoma grayi]|uniref:hypothetical protein n=1 Tax=Trypanosoma grayi TaxID=71804 RepID=UPI0004F4575C|nr:hypothetical protein DQ04_00641050 [Trypanosoma grayi]KEG14061.1 hypothetical protein DQ04_00641050 [Trypanosoma grayi]